MNCNTHMVLGENEVHIWMLHLDQVDARSSSMQYDSLLCAQEIERSARYSSSRVRQRYVMTRVLVRTVLSRYEPVLPREWQFSKTESGRPIVASRCQRGAPPQISFSIAHTGTVIVCAVARETVLGIDIEELIPKPPLSIAKHFFTRIEAAAVAQCPADNQASLFYRLWTLKEAYLKAIGTGLSQPLDGIEFQFCSDTITVTHKSPAAKKHRDCTFWSLQASPVHVAAVCVRRRPAIDHHLHVWRSIPLREQSPCTWPQLARSL